MTQMAPPYLRVEPFVFCVLFITTPLILIQGYDETRIAQTDQAPVRGESTLHAKMALVI